MGLMKKLTSAIVASSLVFTLVGSASAAYTADAGNTAATRMQALKIVQGMPDGTLGLDKEITRAELVTIIVRAFGQEDNAKLLQGSTGGFTDTAKHWASGNIAMAQALVAKVGGDAIGMPDGSFSPDGKLTPAQAVAFLMKFLGVKADPAKAWPANYLDKAADMGLIAADDKAVIAGQANTNSTRGLAFYLFDRAFASYTLPTGKTFYTQYVDQTAPELTIKNEAASTTMDASVTVTGTVTGASELYVGSTKVTPDASGNFSADVALGEVKADPYTITVTARDLAGNKTEKSIQVTRTVGTAAVIEASDITVAAGATADVAVTVKDAKGNVLAGQTATGTSTVGTFADGKFTAAKAVGTGKLTLTVGTLTKDVNVTINAGPLATVTPSKASAAPGEMVTLTAQDEFGNTVTGVTYSQTSANAMLDATSGKFMASKAGVYTITAKAGDKTVEAKVGVYDSTVDHYAVTLSSPTLIANNKTVLDVTISAVDVDGNLIADDASAGVTISAPGLVQDDGTTAVPATVTLKNGTKVLHLVTDAAAVGGQIVTVKANSGAATEGKATLELLDQVATTVKVSAVDAYVASNDASGTGRFKVYVADQTGNQMLSNALATSIDLTLTGPAKITATGTADPLTDETTATTTKTISFTGSKVIIEVTATQNGTGPITLNATSAGLTAGTATMTAQTAGAAAKLVTTLVSDDATAIANSDARDAADTTEMLKYKVVVTDANGVPIKAALPGGHSVVAKFDVSDSKEAQVFVATATSDVATNWETGDFRDLTDGAVPPAPAPYTAKQLTVSLSNGVGYFAVKANKFTGALNVTVKDTSASGAYTSSTAAMNFVADGYTTVGTAATDVHVSSSTPDATVTAQLYDAAGNKVAASGVELQLDGATDDVTVNGTTRKAKATTDANGVATFKVHVLGEVEATYTFTVTGDDVDGNALTTVTGGQNNTVVTVAKRVATSITVDIIADAGSTYRGVSLTPNASVGSVDAGATVTIKATVKDANSKYVGGETIEATVTTGEIDESTPVTLTETGLDTGIYTAVVTPTKAGRLAVSVSDTTASSTVTGTDAIGVGAGAAAKVRVSRVNDSDSLSIGSNKVTGPFTVQVVDDYNNVVVTPTGVTVDLSGANLEFRKTQDGTSITSVTIAAGTSSSTFYVVTGEDAGASLTLGAADHAATLDADSVTVSVSN